MTVRKMMVSFALMGMIGSASAKEDNPRFDIILLIGQSNMAGQGKVEPQDRRAIPGVFKLTSNAQWAPAKDPTTRANLASGLAGPSPDPC